MQYYNAASGIPDSLDFLRLILEEKRLSRGIHIQDDSVKEIRSDAFKDSINVLVDFAVCDPMNEDVFGVALGTLLGMIPTGGLIAGFGYEQSANPWVKIIVDTLASRFRWVLHTSFDGAWWLEKTSLNISFIIPAYNCAKTIRESLNSIFEGNFEAGDEIIVTDDFSADNTGAIINEYISENPAIKLFRHTQNKGGAAARNACVRNTNNSLIFCLDSDNVLEAGSVKKLKRHLIESCSDVAAFQELRYFQSNIQEITHRWVFRPNEVTLQDCLANHVIPPASGNYLYTKASWESVGGYPEFAKALDSWGFGVRQVAHGYKMTVLPDTGYFHRYGHESYWIRENRTKQTTAIATQILEPYKDLLTDDSVAYIHSDSGATWFDMLESKPLLVVGGSLRKSGQVVRDATFTARENKCFFVKALSALKRIIFPKKNGSQK